MCFKSHCSVPTPKNDYLLPIVRSLHYSLLCCGNLWILEQRLHWIVYCRALNVFMKSSFLAVLWKEDFSWNKKYLEMEIYELSTVILVNRVFTCSLSNLNPCRSQLPFMPTSVPRRNLTLLPTIPLSRTHSQTRLFLTTQHLPSNSASVQEGQLSPWKHSGSTLLSSSDSLLINSL